VKVPIVLLVVVTATLSAPSNAQVSQQSPQDATVMERGRYVIEIAAACGICHTTRGADGQLLPNMKLAGGRVIVDRASAPWYPTLPLTRTPGSADGPTPRSRLQSARDAGRTERSSVRSCRSRSTVACRTVTSWRWWLIYERCCRCNMR
jgi:hypothetical protein